MFDFFSELFAPGRRHAAEERKRLDLSREDLGVGDPARGPIDLSSGKVTLRRPGRARTGDAAGGPDGPERTDGPDGPTGPPVRGA
ncbi:DUF6191 domain-containing protein [Streptomyces sp. NBC_01754]|uniref:DUF6191 domain-containing protein n=1 Tax=Streptomyces sp. NBC_01754 TaxID=2975930 RepID=UPI002DDC7BC8|nr:DUF6191 domain-containing protein [Streptomyces sp. NBC_01754]WSC94986.1 DUF6191 domain-containing protein [Streptomyces sp. NBC_01754]